MDSFITVDQLVQIGNFVVYRVYAPARCAACFRRAAHAGRTRFALWSTHDTLQLVGHLRCGGAGSHWTRILARTAEAPRPTRFADDR